MFLSLAATTLVAPVSACFSATMSEGSVEEGNPNLPITSALYTSMDVNKIIHSCNFEDDRQGYDNAA